MGHGVNGNLGPKWERGQSGNPGGRPKVPNLTARLAAFAEKTELGGKTLPRGRTAIDLFCEQVWMRAMNDVQWAKLLCDRLWGPAPSFPDSLDPDIRAILANKSLESVIADQLRRTAEAAAAAETDDKANPDGS